MSKVLQALLKERHMTSILSNKENEAFPNFFKKSLKEMIENENEVSQ